MKNTFKKWVLNIKMVNYIFDTNCFYQISFKELDLINSDDNNYFYTKVQKRELEEHEINEKFTQDWKDRILKLFSLIEQGEKSLGTGIFGHKDAGVLPMTLGTSGWYEKIKKDLDKFKEEENNSQDALITEVALINNLILVTNEKKIIQVIGKYKPNLVLNFKDYKNSINKSQEVSAK